MSRGLNATQEALVELNAYLVENLIEIGSTYYTDGTIDVDVETTTSGGVVTFSANSKLDEVGSVEEKSYFSNVKIAITFIGADLSTQLAFTNGTRVVIHKMFRDVSTGAVVATDPIRIFDGIIVSKRLNFDGENQTLQLECTPDNIGIYKTIDLPPLLKNVVGT